MKKNFFLSKLLVSTQGLDLVHNILVLIGIVKMNLKILCVENLKYKILLVKALKEVSQASGEILILYLTAGAERWGRNWLHEFHPVSGDIWLQSSTLCSITVPHGCPILPCVLHMYSTVWSLTPFLAVFYSR